MKLLLYSTILFIFISCDRQKKTENFNYSFIKKERILFPVDETVNPYAMSIEFVPNTNGKNYLWLLDGNRQLSIYDFDLQKLYKKIKLEQEGNNGVGRANGFKVISFDSILITSTFSQKIFLINSSGEVLNSYSFKCDSLFTFETRYSTNNHQLIIENDELIIHQPLAGDSKEYFNNYSTAIRLNTKTGEIKKAGMKLPFKYPDLYAPRFSSTKIKDLYVYSFFAKDSLYVVDKQGGTSHYHARSNNIIKLQDSKRKYFSSIESEIRDHIGRGLYRTLLPDTANNIIYRIYKIGSENISPDDNLWDLNRYPPNFGVQVFNDSFELIADIVFPKQTYFYLNSFTNKDGLFISANHPYNPDFDVNYFAFDRFVFQKNK